MDLIERGGKKYVPLNLPDVDFSEVPHTVMHLKGVRVPFGFEINGTFVEPGGLLMADGQTLSAHEAKLAIDTLKECEEQLPPSITLRGPSVTEYHRAILAQRMDGGWQGKAEGPRTGAKIE